MTAYTKRITPAGQGLFFPSVVFGTASTTFTALRLFVVPVWVPELIPTVTGIRWQPSVNTTGGNFAIGFFDSTGALVVQSTSAAFPAAGNVASPFSAAQTNVIPGLYYLGWAAELGTFRGSTNSVPGFRATNAATAPASVVTMPGSLGTLIIDGTSPNIGLY